ncbi:hypothetical protein PIB30_093917, partial [Stylosanthes scabra]|nr:hypothetical protein [Stylosanthes scabra]
TVRGDVRRAGGTPMTPAMSAKGEGEGLGLWPVGCVVETGRAPLALRIGSLSTSLRLGFT